MQLTLPRPNGDQVRYETGAVAEEVIGALRIAVFATHKREMLDQLVASLAAAL